MYTAKLILASDKYDLIGVFKDGEKKHTLSVKPTASAEDYENALRFYGFNPVEWDGTSWTVEKIEKVA